MLHFDVYKWVEEYWIKISVEKQETRGENELLFLAKYQLEYALSMFFKSFSAEMFL